jgi:hypothetical protein
MFPIPEYKTHCPPTAAAEKAKHSAGQFPAKFASHYERCQKLGKRFTTDDPKLKESAAISQLCRASQEMMQQAKQARMLTDIYLTLDDSHREMIRPIITAGFKDISKLASDSWRRFRDSVALARTANPDIQLAQREFQPHADEFQDALAAFIAMIAKAR